MIDADKVKRLTELCNKPVALGGWLGLPYEKDGCLLFAVRFYRELGIYADVQAMREARHFKQVVDPQFADMAVFYNSPTLTWHVGVMLTQRIMIQCSPECITNGVGKVPIDLYPWAEHFRDFYRHKLLCS